MPTRRRSRRRWSRPIPIASSGAPTGRIRIGGSAASINEIAKPFDINDGLLLNELAKWVPDAATRKKILVDNPARLYGFDPAAG